MHALRYVIVWPFFFLLVWIICIGCDTSDPENPFNDNDWIIMGDREGMIYQAFDPPMEVPIDPRSGLMIYPDSLSDQFIQLSIYTSGPTGCRNYKEEAMIGGSDSISFLYQYEEHMQYYSVQWAEYVYTWDGVEIDSVYEHFRSFDETDAEEGSRGMEILSVYHLADSVFQPGHFREGGSLWYLFDPRQDYSQGTRPGGACRINSDSSYIRNDSTVMFFTTNYFHYSFNQELYNPDGVYAVFKLTEGDRERLGWLKITTTGHRTTVFECAVQR